MCPIADMCANNDKKCTKCIHYKDSNESDWFDIKEE